MPSPFTDVAAFLIGRWASFGDVTHAAMEDEGAYTLESATTVLFNYVLTPMWDEIRRLDELIKQNRKEPTS